MLFPTDGSSFDMWPSMGFALENQVRTGLTAGPVPRLSSISGIGLGKHRPELPVARKRADMSVDRF